MLFIILQYVFHIDLIAVIANCMKNFGIERPLLTEKASLGIVFLYGLLSSVHCVGMCGGIVLSISTNKNNRSGIISNIQYQCARILSYGAVGFVLGAFGSILTIPKAVQGYIPIICGVLMLITGVSMMVGKTAFSIPKWHARFIGRAHFSNAFALGALSALLPCGTMQAVQFYAIANTDALKGMLSMIFFALGTVPLMLLFGILSSVLKDRNLKRILPLTAVLIIILAVQMIIRGLNIVGY